ncbi:MAG TPA: alpha-L-arabinofuranosidase C-terminal domain-containing protein [Chitinophaga sp.]|uniref:alpha-N-arabinofuranosidase n=1 Tax=Chitinophaga sp. TaxID=1869181 RepID=UPI002C6D4B25|nr:alpha-L-arabinofuranosidase C-terminal domain-containing protein [Chitinophaga sp.]HVI47170.1 alpha-L-arabinofuranosidase C-terminal domain-containing protein [Chitinophaga sp.]
MNQIRFISQLMLCLLLTVVAAAQNTVTLRNNPSAPVISRNIYGHFAEHLGRCIYDGFYVGDSSRIPNTKGVRKDIIDALRRLKVPVLRWPGGCFADTYHWKDGIGPKDRRPTIVNTWWGNVTENNSFGTHDFLDMCEELGAMPYLAGNVGSGTVQELSDWVQYVNFDGISPMSKLREQNGRKAPWKVRYWGVGNEAWGCGGNMRPEYYVDLYRKYATFMHADWGNDHLFRIASGANSGDYNWTEMLMKNIPQHLLEGVALHHYAVINWNQKSDAVDFTERQYFQTMRSALLMDTLVSRHAAIMDKYDPRKRVALVVDEWGGWYNVETGTNPGFLYQQNTMRDAMIAAATLNIFNNHADRVRMANLAQTVNVLQAVVLTKGSQLLLTPTYHVMEMYNVHQDATLIPIDIHCNDYTLEKEKLPAVSVSASRDKSGLTHISLANIHATAAQEITLQTGETGYRHITGRILTSSRLQDCNTFTSPDKIKPAVFREYSLKNNSITLKLPPFSVVVLELQ